MIFYIGTTNNYKTREFASILCPLGIELRVTSELDPEETGETLEENSVIKASAYGKHIGNTLINSISDKYSEVEIRKFLEMSQVFVISEDSGIEIPVLNGLPGPWSARFDDCVVNDGKIVAHNASARSRDEIDLANNLKILELMQGMNGDERVATFGVCLTVADTNGDILFSVSNRVLGRLSTEMIGLNGFGYDPIFITDTSFGKTWAQIDPMRKNLFSHRRDVLQKFIKWSTTQLKSALL